MRFLVRALFETLIRVFFPSIEIRGRERIPARGPWIFVLNHPNGLLDPVVLRVALGRPVAFLAKSTLFLNPLGRLAMSAFSAIPVYRAKDAAVGGGDTSRNEQTFALCRAALARGEALALFPEGVSHADAQLKPLKTGAARIALSAEREHDGTLGVKIVPVGLAYSERSVFRSHVVLRVGEPIELTEFYTRFLADERAAVEALTDTIRSRLDAVVLQAETRELLDGAVRLAHWTADGRGASGDDEARARELLDAYASLRERDPTRADEIVSQARRYARLLERLGVSDPWAVEVDRIHPVPAFGVLLRWVLLSPLALVGAALGWIPYRLAGRLAARVAREEDVLGTVKLLAGALFLTLAWSIEAVAVGIWRGAPYGIALFVIAPITGYAALRWDELGALAIEALRHAAVRRLRPEVAERIAARRRELASTVAEALRRSVVAS